MIRRGRHFLQIPGPTNTPDRILRAMAAPTIDHRGPEFAELGHEVLDGLKTVFQTESPVVVYPASGSGAWEAVARQHALPRRRRARVRHRRVLEELGRGGPPARLRRRAHARHLAARRRSRRGRRAARPRSRPSHQGPARRPQRDVHGRDEPSSRDPARHRPRAASGPAARGRGLVAGLDRSPARRVGARRHARGIAEGPDAAAGSQFQRDQRESARRLERGPARPAPTGPGTPCSPPT